MEQLKNFIDSFVSYFHNAGQTMQFGIILILVVVGLLILISLWRLFKFLFKKIVSLFSKKEEKVEVDPAPAQNSLSSSAVVIPPQESSAGPETRVLSYLDDEIRKFKTNMGSIPVEELKEEKEFPASPYSMDSLSREQFSELSERKKKDIRKRLKNLNLRDLKRQQAYYTKKSQTSSESMEKETVSFQALLLSRDKAQNDCSELYNQHKSSYSSAKTTQEKVFADSVPVEQNMLKIRAQLDDLIAEKERLLAALEKNRASINGCVEESDKAVISAYQYVEVSTKSINTTCAKHHEDASAYLGSVSELNLFNNNLFHSLENFTTFAKERAEATFALECIEENILAIQAAEEEQKRKEAEEAERIRKEKEAERERIRLEKKAEAERRTREKEEAEALAKAEAEQKEKERQLQLQQEEILALKEKAELALSKAEDLNRRSAAVEREKAEVEAKKQALAEERERERAEREAQKAAAKAEREAKEAERKAQKAAREKAELDRLMELTEEEKEVRRMLAEINEALPSRSSLAAEEGFVNEKRLNEIKESQATLENEQAKRAAEKEAMRLAVEKKQKEIMANSSALDDESNSREQRMEALREQWRLERENKERFEAEQARKALEVEERKKALADANNASGQ